ncbi:hypothetical protein ACP275_14G123600 [Erythranthe tilingii]
MPHECMLRSASICTRLEKLSKFSFNFKGLTTDKAVGHAAKVIAERENALLVAKEMLPNERIVMTLERLQVREVDEKFKIYESFTEAVFRLALSRREIDVMLWTREDVVLLTVTPYNSPV